MPYRGPVRKGVDTTTLTGKVMTGYQGWFNCPTDGANLGWTHWSQFGAETFGPGKAKIDLWPDMSEFPAKERYVTAFKHDDGRLAEVFSSHQASTVFRHFKWMREYGIDGAFVQRFASGLSSRRKRFHKDVVLANCREGANREGRTYALMYDLSGLSAGEVGQVVDDWRMLRKTMQIGDDPAYLQHHGKPLVAIWGVGFNGDREYNLDECGRLVEALKSDGCSVMLGVPTGWRELERDSVDDAKLHAILKQADVISPWTVGRYRTPHEVVRHGKDYWQPDQVWCEAHAVDYLPVVFPGFSWHNMNPKSPLDQIPRLKGEFLWSQFVTAKASGAKMIYVAMFDEVDEGTAIFKCTNDPPAGSFLTYDGLPSDHYLWLTGEGARMLRGERSIVSKVPQRVR